jgi:hypothetical protein
LNTRQFACFIPVMADAGVIVRTMSRADRGAIVSKD